MVTAYCVVCGKKDKEKGKNKTMKDPVIGQTSRGGYIAKGTCPDCGTKVCAMMSKEKAEAALASGEAQKEVKKAA
jgi:hypothetical protein